MRLEEYLAIPYVMDVAPVQDANGEWVCRLQYDELPGCRAEGATPFEALERLEQQREHLIRTRYEQNQPIPAPRPPLRA
jgi:predicted RNase H-like HicB family nuclease